MHMMNSMELENLKMITIQLAIPKPDRSKLKMWNVEKWSSQKPLKSSRFKGKRGFLWYQKMKLARLLGAPLVLKCFKPASNLLQSTPNLLQSALNLLWTNLGASQGWSNQVLSALKGFGPNLKCFLHFTPLIVLPFLSPLWQCILLLSQLSFKNLKEATPLNWWFTLLLSS